MTAKQIKDVMAGGGLSQRPAAGAPGAPAGAPGAPMAMGSGAAPLGGWSLSQQKNRHFFWRFFGGEKRHFYIKYLACLLWKKKKRKK